VDWLKDVVTWADRAFTSAGRAQARLAALNGGGNGEPTKVDSQIASITAAGDSRVAQMNAYNAIRYEYEGRIKALQERINGSAFSTATSQSITGASPNFTSSLDLRTELAAVEKMRDDFMARAAKILFATEGGGTAAPSPVDAVIEEAAKTTKTTKETYIPLAGSIDAQTAKVKELQDAFNAAGSDGIRMGPQNLIHSFSSPVPFFLSIPHPRRHRKASFLLLFRPDGDTMISEKPRWRRFHGGI
jgi:hypothetical protein